MDHSDSRSSSRNSSLSGSLVSQESSRFLAKRRAVGDRVLITSNSKVHLNPSKEPVGVIGAEGDYDGCDKTDYEMVSDSIRSSKDLPKIRNTIFEDSLESQEVSFYVDEFYSDANSPNEYESCDSFESDSDEETSCKTGSVEPDKSFQDTPLPELPPESNGLVKFAENVKKIKKNLSRDLTKSLRRISRKITLIEPDVRVSTPSPTTRISEAIVETPALITHVAVGDLKPTMPTRETDKPAVPMRDTERPVGFLSRIRKSMSLSADAASNITSKYENQRRSTFYLTEVIDIDGGNGASTDSGIESNYVVVAAPRDVPNQGRPKLARPKSPPPPAPLQNEVSENKSSPKENRTKSLYAEAGLFKNENFKNRPNERKSWYAESGLYSEQDKDNKINPKKINYANVLDELNVRLSISNVNNNNSIEEYTGNVEIDSTYNNQSIRSFNSSSSKTDEPSFYVVNDLEFLQDEPLYQFYDAAVLKSIYSDDISDFEADIYEDVDQTNEDYISSNDLEFSVPSNLFTRSLWCEVPEVKKSAVLSQLSVQQKKLQEAKFEVITSEASYLNSLNVLVTHFLTKFKKSDMVNEKEVEKLFGKIKEVRSCSKKILKDLEKCWHKNILLDGICEVIQRHAEEDFGVYIHYCGNQVMLSDALNQIKERPGFLDFLTKLESSTTCHYLSLYSFLMLPMQRITRWPLLVDAILKRLSETDPEYLTCQHALASLNKIVSQCNEAAKNKEREIELHKISKSLEFPGGIPYKDIISADRWLVKSGAVTQLQPRSDDGKMTFGKRFNKFPLNLFLFNDMLLVTKKKSEKTYAVLHYCSGNFVELRIPETFPVAWKKDVQDKNVIYFSILENQDGKTVEFLLSTASETDRERWIEAFSPPKSENPDETLYECWDCPQVDVLHNYSACQPDELSLARGDVINVLRKMSDGWYYGEKLRDGQTGWFPANHTSEIVNPHVRARNLKQRYRLLMFSECYLKS